MIAHSDDGIVVLAMNVEEFDWDRFEAEGEEIARRMREVSRTSAERIAALQAERARYEERRASDAVARETPPPTGPDDIGGILNRFEHTLAGITNELALVRADLSILRTDLSTLRTDLSTLRADVSTLRADVSTLRADVSDLRDELTDLRENVSDIREELSDLRESVSAIRERMATKVEVEALQYSVQIVADGYAQTQHRVAEAAGLLRRYLTAAD